MISKRQKDVLDFITDYESRRGYSPSYEEIGGGLGVSSKSTVFKHIKSLKERGLISDVPGKRRSLYLKHPGYPGCLDKNQPLHIPLYGYIQAGYPVEAVQIDETVTVPEGFAGRNAGDIFALRVRGDSMSEDMITDRDVIILKKTREVTNGRIVAAIIDECEATLKRYYKTSDGRVKLMPSNPAFKPIIIEADRVKIIGELVGLIRKY